VANLPTDIANQALDAIGVEFTLGDIEEGTRPAQVLLRAYWQCLRQLLRAAHWDFARKQAPLSLLADATGNTPNVGTIVSAAGWTYEYQYPIDCMKARFVPAIPPNQASGIPPGNISINVAVPQMTGIRTQAPFPAYRLRPARFLIGTDYNYPPQQGQITWEVQGVSPQGRSVIFTNVQNAQLVYTALMNYPSNWDVLFRAAMVSYLASEVALALHKDKKFGLQMRGEQIKIAKEKIIQARITDGNEGWATNDISVDWIRTRSQGVGWGGFSAGGWAGESGPGVFWYGWDSCSFGDGSAY
jgi:hypothetical protein